jgi:hypothetical protein
MKRKYVRAHPESRLGRSYTDAATDGWELVAINPDGYPIFRESFWRWVTRVVLRRRCYVSKD